MQNKVAEIANLLELRNVRVHVDSRPHIRPGPKFFEWERKGVPIRIEVGMRDLAANVVTMSRRIGVAEKSAIHMDALPAAIDTTLAAIQNELLEAAQTRLREKLFRLNTYAEMKAHLEAAAAQGSTETAGFYLVPWHASDANEQAIKEDCKATIRCFPTFANNQDAQKELQNEKCFYSGLQATHRALFARAF